MKNKLKEIRKVNGLMRFIKSLETYDNKKAFNDYMKRKELKI